MSVLKRVSPSQSNTYWKREEEQVASAKCVHRVHGWYGEDEHDQSSAVQEHSYPVKLEQKVLGELLFVKHRESRWVVEEVPRQDTGDVDGNQEVEASLALAIALI